jgi:putative endopeptidase
LATHPIPPEESRWGAFIVLRHEVEKQLKRIVEGTTNQKIRDLYRSGMDMKRRNRLGAKPIAPWLAEINNLESRKNLTHLLARLEKAGVGVPFETVVDQDAKDSTRYILYLEQDGLGMPDRDYYLKHGLEQKRVRAAYEKHIQAVFALLGDSKGDAFKKTKTVMTVETRLAKASMDKVSLRDPDKTYHKKTIKQISALATAVNWSTYFEVLGAPRMQSLILSQPIFMKEVDHLVATLPLADWKAYLTFHVANDAASALSQPFIDESFAFYGKVLTGLKEMRPLWRRVLGAVNGSLGELVGKQYVKKHFSSASKRRMDMLVDDLFAAFEERVKGLDWMSPATKKKALKKLHAINRKLGYPSKWKSYKGLEVKSDEYFGNLARAELYEHQRAMRKIGKPIARHEWHMTPQTVNAYYSPTMNEIVFPAAILQPPFFGLSMDDAVNYGAIGSTIGHEITHGFDDSGAKFDADGNLKRWWTVADEKRFKARARILAEQFDRYEAAPGAKVNGNLTLGENIADLGGISIAYDAYVRHGGNNFKKFFIGWAEAEREHARHEFLKMIVTVDPHSPAEFRINGPASNLPEFYSAFSVAKGDTLYRESRHRAKIW